MILSVIGPLVVGGRSCCSRILPKEEQYTDKATSTHMVFEKYHSMSLNVPALCFCGLVFASTGDSQNWFVACSAASTIPG